MHHVHMSTEFMFVLAFLVIGLTAVILAFVASIKRDRREATTRQSAPPPHSTSGAPRSSGPFHPSASPAPSGSYSAPPMAAAAPVYVHGGGSTDLLTGVLLGEAIAGGHRHETVIHETYSAPSHHSDSSSSYSSSSSSDSSSGFSFDSGSSSSSDSGSSGGFDASW